VYSSLADHHLIKPLFPVLHDSDKSGQAFYDLSSGVYFRYSKRKIGTLSIAGFNNLFVSFYGTHHQP